MSIATHKNSILILDFCRQYTHLIANRIRRCGAYSEIVSNDIFAKKLKSKNPAEIIFSRGPHSVFKADSLLATSSFRPEQKWRSFSTR